MIIILCRWGSICEPGILQSLTKLGHTVIEFKHTKEPDDYDKDYMLRLVDLISHTPNAKAVFSVNFSPIISRACKPFRIPYISYTVDCPCSTLYSKTIEYPHNRLFLFDQLQAGKFAPKNPEHTFHTILACDTEHFDSITISEADKKRYSADISFIGSLYTEISSYNKVADKLPAYIRGYTEGLICAQRNVYGYNFLEDSISDTWVSDFIHAVGFDSLPDDYEPDLKGIIADTYLGSKCTEQERIHTLQSISTHFSVDLYTQSDSSMLPRVHNLGPADSQTVMPKIFKCSKINLNITSRSIKSGIPQRVLDILGCGGFLISNYQPELAEYFTPGEDLVLYNSIDDLISKIDFYLSNEEERLRIAKNGYNKVKQYHTYDIRLAEILDVALT